MIKDKLAGLTASLTSALLHSLSEPSHRKTSVVYLTSLLTKLGAGPAARATFLTTRGELIRKRIRSIPFEGDIPLYIFDLAIVVFTAIKHTAEWFLASFRENESASRECIMHMASRYLVSRPMCRPCSMVQRTDRELRRLIWQAGLQPGCRPEDDCRMQRHHKSAEQEGWCS